MRTLITGAAGFVGHHLLDYLLETTEDKFVLIDRLDHSGTLQRLEEIRQIHGSKTFEKRVRMVFHDLRAPINEHVRARIGYISQVYHLAAASHVDRSITEPMAFVEDNIVGTVNLLNFVRSVGKGIRFLYASTDEVFGPAPDDVRWKENDRYNSGNPYAASKAGAEQMCVAFANTYGMSIKIANTMNVVGERQSPEKFLPATINKILSGEEVTIHADPTCTKAGSRFYIHALDVARGMKMFMESGINRLNIVGERELDNLQLAQMIASACNAELKYKLVDFHSSRPGHDLRYALDGTRLDQLGFVHSKPIGEHIDAIVKWTLENDRWLA